MRKQALFCFAAGCLATLVAPLEADWLVLRDGSRVETRGAWEEKGRLLVFVATDGTKTSLRLADVDLDASHAATEAAIRAASLPPPPAPERKAPVLVLTDQDVGHVEEEEAASAEGTEVAPQEKLTVVDWEQETAADGQGVLVLGRLRNDGKAVATRIDVTVQILDAEGTVVGTAAGQLSSPNLAVGETATFRASFPEVVGFDTARFDVTSRAFPAAPGAGAAAEAEEGGVETNGTSPSPEAAEDTGELLEMPADPSPPLQER